MTIRYVWSGSAQDDFDSTWNSSTISYLTLNAGLDAWISGDEVRVHVGATTPHFETFAAAHIVTTTAADSETDPIPVYGVDKDNSDAPLTVNDGASHGGVNIETTTINDHLTFNLSARIHGLSFDVGKTAGTGDLVFQAQNLNLSFYGSKLKVGTGNNDDMLGPDDLSTLRCEDCIFDIADQWKSFEGIIEIIGGSFKAGINPSINPGQKNKRLQLIGVDLSSITAGNTIVGLIPPPTGIVEAINCKMPATWSGVTGTFGEYSTYVAFLNSDDSNLYERNEVYSKAGDVKTDTGVYITTGGWLDKTANATGVPLSHKMVPSSECMFAGTLDDFLIRAYINATGTYSFTVELIDDFATTLQDDEVWLDIHYHKTSGQTQRVLATTRILPGTAAANLAAGTGLGNWTGEPAKATPPRSVKLVASGVVVGNIGWYEAFVRLGKYEANDANGDAGASLWVAPLLAVA